MSTTIDTHEITDRSALRIPVRPAEHEVLAAALDTVKFVDSIDIVRCHIDSDEFIQAPVMARVGLLARAGMHYLLIERPARQAELKEVSEAISTGMAGRRNPYPQVGYIPHLPVRCDDCHDRLISTLSGKRRDAA